jgi:ABC-2 type transport system ATP-binding protein
VRARKLNQEHIAGLARWTTSAQLVDEQLTLTTRSHDALPEILRHLVAAGADVYQFTPQRLSLEELFVQIMGEDRGL